MRMLPNEQSPPQRKQGNAHSKGPHVADKEHEEPRAPEHARSAARRTLSRCWKFMKMRALWAPSAWMHFRSVSTLWRPDVTT
jgi:hypothetical protein